MGAVAHQRLGIYRSLPDRSLSNFSQALGHGSSVEYALALKGGNQRGVVIRADGTTASSEGKTAIDRNDDGPGENTPGRRVGTRQDAVGASSVDCHRMRMVDGYWK